MRKHWKSLALALLLIVTMVGMGQSTKAGATPTSRDGVEVTAHNFDLNSTYTCEQESPPNGEPSSVWVTRHSHPVALTEAYVDYSCCQWDGAREVRFWVTLWWNGAHNAHGGYRYGVLGTDCF